MKPVEPSQPFLEPLRKAVTVQLAVGDAFDVFTAGIGRWWPLEKFSISQERAATCAIEPRVGGKIYEQRDDGERFEWGWVSAWEPPHRLVLRWHPGHPAAVAQEVEVRFRDQGTSTRVELEHRGWESLGGEAKEARESYSSGWETVLVRHFAPACEKRAADAPSRT
jgi:uncharacterized protein YndB with AHSA1/START domain